MPRGSEPHAPIYDTIGTGYTRVEPSTAMLAQRGSRAAPAVQGSADALPLRDGAFCGGMAVLTVHHWSDPAAGLAELRRVTDGPVVVVTFDHASHDQQWLTAEYLPAIADLDPDLPSTVAISEALGGGVIEAVAVPHDCVDGFLHAYWRRPEAYLDPRVRAGISGISRLPAQVVEPAMARLADDIDSGAWATGSSSRVRDDRRAYHPFQWVTWAAGIREAGVNPVPLV